jgi:hypothetical protein
LFLDQIHEFYKNLEDTTTCIILEAVFANNLEYFYLTRKEGSFTTAQIIQIIDILTFMAAKTEKSTNYRHLTQILYECINCFEFDRSNISPDALGSTSNVYQAKQRLINTGIINS